MGKHEGQANSLHCLCSLIMAITTSNSVLSLSSDLRRHHDNQPRIPLILSSRSHSVSLIHNKRPSSLALRCFNNADNLSSEKDTPIELSNKISGLSDISILPQLTQLFSSFNLQSFQHFQRLWTLTRSKRYCLTGTYTFFLGIEAFSFVSFDHFVSLIRSC